MEGSFLTQRFLAQKAPSESEPKTKENMLIQAVQNRLARKQDARIIIGGEGGIGKSALALSLAERLNPRLYVKNIPKAVSVGISFTGKQYLESVRTLDTEDFLDFDEPAQGMYHRQFMTEVNMILSKTFIGFRYKRYISSLSVPNIDLLDIDAVKLANFFIWVDKQGHCTVYRILPQKFGGDPYFATMIDSMTFSMPGKELWEKYEERKFANQDSLYAEFDRRLEELNAPKLTQTEMVSIIADHPDRFYEEVNGEDMIHYSRIQSQFGVGINRAYALKRMALAEILRRESQKTPDKPSTP